MQANLENLIALVESDENFSAERYEENFKFSEDAIIKIVKYNQCDRETAEKIAKTSYGAYQIMGENIYTICGFKNSITHFLDSPTEQKNILSIFLYIKNIKYDLIDMITDPAKRYRFIRLYNGPASIEIYDKRLLKKFKYMINA